VTELPVVGIFFILSPALWWHHWIQPFNFPLATEHTKCRSIFHAFLMNVSLCLHKPFRLFSITAVLCMLCMFLSAVNNILWTSDRKPEVCTNTS